MILDGTKIDLYKDRVEAWERGEHIAPVTVDIALTTTCNMACQFCFRYLQHNKISIIEAKHINYFLEDCKEIGVQGVSLVSDGESSISPIFKHTILYGHWIGLAMACGTNGYLLDEGLATAILPNLTYLRINISAGEEKRYNEIMGAKPGMFRRVLKNIKWMVEYKEEFNTKCTIGMQMVFMPQYEDQLIPLAELAIALRVDYLVIKHCSDDEFGSLGVKYGDYEKCYEKLKEAESMSNERTKIEVKWSKIKECNEKGAIRTYSNCYGAPFILQLSGSGLVAPCGMLFNERYKWAHIGNITRTRFKEMWKSSKYWEVMNYLAGRGTIEGMEPWDAKTDCGSLCLQHCTNRALDNHIKGNKIEFNNTDVLHRKFL